MKNNDCKMARGLKILLGIFFGFLALGLVVIGITYVPVIGILMAVLFLAIALMFLFAPRDPSCYLNR
jgi:hypothetical protein